MTLSAGTRLGPYEILSPLGAGGMGEVYKAQDTRLERTVAVKVLPQHLSSSAEIRQRFEREAKTISQLSHPHICALYDVGNQDGVEYLVMEYLEGETLAERLAKGPLSLERALRYSVEIAGALDRAHRQGIVHRDLKPGNVMLTKSGVKLLDFGLAKAIQSPASTPNLTALPTAARNLTAEGTILGTFQYMAPEQLEGREDARTDIFAFGAVLYEMATGRKAFSGTSQASTIGAILHTEPPPISAAQPMAPPPLDRVVKTCLSKDPDDRFQTAHDVRLELQWIAEGGSQVSLPASVIARRRSRERLWAVWAILSTVAAIALAAWMLGNRPEPSPSVLSSILPPEGVQFAFGWGAMALSPDGSRVAFPGSLADGKRMLFVRPLAAISAQPLAGTEGAAWPFWSPDSRFLGFFASGKLKKIEASGGPPETICDAQSGRGGSWNREGVIVFAATHRSSLARVSAAGGPPAPATELVASRGETTHRLPFFLPDGRHFLYLALSPAVGGTSNALWIGSLDSKKGELLLRADSSAVFAAASAGASRGHLLFLREETLMAQPFDAKKRRLTGEAFPVAEHVSQGQSNNAIVSVSENGLLAYQAAGSLELSQLTWFDRNGKELEALGAPATYNRPRLSHDDLRVAVEITDSQTRAADIWVCDLTRRTQTRFTFDSADDSIPIWSPDDTRIAFMSGRKGPGDLYWKATDGTGAKELLLATGETKPPSDWSADGLFIAFTSFAIQNNRGSLWGLSLPDRKPTLVLQAAFSVSNGQFSPDRRWMAYQSEESGRTEIYVMSFPGPGGKWQVSTAGGRLAAWGRNGKEIFYLAPDGKLMSVDVKTAPTFQAGIPKALYSVRIKNTGGRHYDVSADSQKFLVNVPVGQETAKAVTLVQKWAAGRGR